MTILRTLSWLIFIDVHAHCFKPTHKTPVLLHIQPCLKEIKQLLIHTSFFNKTVECISHPFIKFPVNEGPICQSVQSNQLNRSYSKEMKGKKNKQNGFSCSILVHANASQWKVIIPREREQTEVPLISYIIHISTKLIPF